MDPDSPSCKTNSSQVWGAVWNLQSLYELRLAEKKAGKSIKVLPKAEKADAGPPVITSLILSSISPHVQQTCAGEGNEPGQESEDEHQDCQNIKDGCVRAGAADGFGEDQGAES